MGLGEMGGHQFSEEWRTSSATGMLFAQFIGIA